MELKEKDAEFGIFGVRPDLILQFDQSGVGLAGGEEFLGGHDDIVTKLQRYRLGSVPFVLARWRSPTLDSKFKNKVWMTLVGEDAEAGGAPDAGEVGANGSIGGG